MTALYIIIAALVITVIALICRIQFMKIEVDYARGMAKLYKESYESEQKSFKDMSDIAEKCNQEAICVLSHYNYEHYKVLTMLTVLSMLNTSLSQGNAGKCGIE